MRSFAFELCPLEHKIRGMDILFQELTAGIPDPAQLAHFLIRLLAAAVLGGVIGWQREKAGKAAGLRTHILVALGTCTFIVICTASNMTSDGISRVIQGIVTGLGFLGAGTILTSSDQLHVKGLTTSAGIWMTAAIGVAAGLGTLGLAILATVITLVVLVTLRKIERKHEPDEST
jgi:putative Mg2+ transporter-C (MgtC) family protein